MHISVEIVSICHKFGSMIGTKLLVCYVIVWLMTSSKLSIRADERLKTDPETGLNKTRGLNIFPGIKFFPADGEIIVCVRMQDLLQETEMQGRKSEQKKNPLQRFGFMMMMTPLVMQILSLPGAVASIKMSLLKSLMVAQLAIAIMLYNLIKSAQNSEVVVIHQPQHHKHYYHNYNHLEDDKEDDWFGR